MKLKTNAHMYTTLSKENDNVKI